MPSKPAQVHRIRLTASKALRLDRAQLEGLGVSAPHYDSVRYERTQRIGAAAWFLECDALIVPSARWPCDNLVLLADRHAAHEALECLGTEAVDWIRWAIEKGFLEANSPEVIAALAAAADAP